MHHVQRREDRAFAVPAAFAGHSAGFARAEHVGREAGAVHAGAASCELAPGGAVDAHVQAYEELVFVVEGAPLLTLGGAAFTLAPGDGVLIGVGEPHAWANPGDAVARWLVLDAPQGPEPRFVDLPEAPARRPGPLDLAFSRWQLADMDGTSPEPLTIARGISMKLIVDERQGATQARTFMIHYKPGAVLPPHDHPFEETFHVLEGEVLYVADGERFVLRAGDVGFAGVGCAHSFEQRGEMPCRWLESQSPLPPARHHTRVLAPWTAG